jgi:hypothetical protein
MSRPTPPTTPATDAWQVEADLLAVGREQLERLCGAWRIRHLYPHGADPSLLLLAYQELDRQRTVGRVGTSRRAITRAMRRIVGDMVTRDAIARNRRLAYGLPTPRAPALLATPGVVQDALSSLDDEARTMALRLLHDHGDDDAAASLATSAAMASERTLAQIRDTLLGAVLGHPEAIRALHPQIVALLASAQPEVQRHPLASYLFIKLPLQLVVGLLALVNVAYICAYYFFNDEVLGRFISSKVSGMVEGELEMGSVHWSGRLLLDLLTGQPSPVVVEDVTVYEPYKSFGGDRRVAAHADRIEATLVLHEIIPWNRLAIPTVFEIPWALHFAEVEIVGESRFDVRGYRDQHEDGRTVSIIGLRDAFSLYQPVPNDKRGLSFAVDRAVLGRTAIDVDFGGLGDWRFATTLDQAEFGLRFISLSPKESIPFALPLQFALSGQGGTGSLRIGDIEVPIDAVDALDMRGGTGDTPFGDVGFTARARAAGSDLDVEGRLRHALARSVDPALEPVAYGTPVVWGPSPTVEMRAATRDAGAVLEHVVAELELPDYALDGHHAALVARVEGPLSDPTYHLAAEGLSIDPLDEPAWVIDDARVSVQLVTDRAPARWGEAYPSKRLVATFDTFEGSALDGTVHLRDGELATIVLPGDDTEPLLLDGDFDLRSTNPAQLAPDDPEVMAKLAGTATGRVRIDELRLGPVTPLGDGGTPMAPEFGLQRARLEFTDVDVERDHGPNDDGLPKTITLDGTITIDEQGDIDWDELRVAIPGATLRSSGDIDGDLSRLGETQLDFSVDDGAAFARGLAIERYVDDLRARMVVGGPLGAPNGRDGRLRVTPSVGPVSGVTETRVWIDAGVLHARGDDVRLLGGRGQVDVEVHVFERGEISDDPRIRATVNLRGVDLRAIDVGPLSGGAASGIADIELEIGDGDGKAARASDLRISGTATVPLLRYAGTEYADATLAFRWTAEQLAIERLVLPLHRRAGPSEEDLGDLEVGRLVVDGTVGLVGDPALDLHVQAGGIPLAAVAQLLGTEVPVHGQIGQGTEFDVGGTLARPSVEGKVALVGLTALGVPLGSGTLEVESDDAPAAGPLAAHREVWAKGELTTGPRGDARIDWSIDAVVAIGKPPRRGASPPVEAQLDVTFDRVGLPLLLRASAVEMPGVEGQIEGLAAHVLTCAPGTTMLTDCARDDGERDGALALAVSLDRAWIRPQPRSTVARQQRASAKSPCEVAGTLCAEGLQATLDGDTLRLDRPLQLRSPDGTDAQLAGAFDLGAATATPVGEATTCRAPPPPPPKVAAVSDAGPVGAGTRATLTGTVALGALQALLEPYGLATAKGLVEVDVDLDGPVAAPQLSGRIDRAAASASLWIQPKGLTFPIELSDIALAITPQWIAARGAVRVFGESLEFGSHAGERTGFAFAGPCAGHFDVAAKGTLGTRLLVWLVGDSVADASGGIDVEHAVVSGNASPFAIERAEAMLAFVDHDLRLRPTEGLDEIALTGGRIAIARCGPGQCDEVPGVPEGALAVYVGGSSDAPGARPGPEALVAEVGARGRVSTWGRLYLDGSTGMPLQTELDVRVVDVAYRDFDTRGRPVAEAEVSAQRLSLRGADPIVVQGEIELARARYVKDAIQGTDILAFADDVEIAETPPPDLIRNLQFDLQVLTDDPLRVENNVATGVEANATVKVTGTYDAPEFAGRIDLESGGRVDLPFLTGTYAIQRGRVNLLGAIEDAEVDIGALREEPIYVDAQPRQLQLLLGGTLAEITWTCVTDGDTAASGQSARSCFDYLVLGTGDVQVSDADVRRFGGGGLAEARKPLQVVGHVTELELDERAQKAVPRLRGYVPDMRLRLGQIGPELRIATPAEWFDFDYGRLSFGWDYTRGYPGFFLRQSRQLTFRFELLEPITIEFSRRIRSYLNQRVIFDPLTQRTIELRFDFSAPSAK